MSNANITQWMENNWKKNIKLNNSLLSKRVRAKRKSGKEKKEIVLPLSIYWQSTTKIDSNQKLSLIRNESRLIESIH